MSDRILHLRPGSDIRAALGRSGVPGELVSWADPLCEGPLRRWATAVDSRRRAAYPSRRRLASFGQALEGLRAQDQGLGQVARYGEAVLWFEHDLFDQSSLVWQRASSLSRSTPRPCSAAATIVAAMADGRGGSAGFVWTGPSRSGASTRAAQW